MGRILDQRIEGELNRVDLEPAQRVDQVLWVLGLETPTANTNAGVRHGGAPSKVPTVRMDRSLKCSDTLAYMTVRDSARLGWQQES